MMRVQNVVAQPAASLAACLLLAVSCLTSGCGDAGKTEGAGAVAQLLSRMPQDRPGLAIFPTPAKTLEALLALDPKASEAFRDRLAEMLGESGPDIPLDAPGDPQRVWDKYGVDSSRPLGFATFDLALLGAESNLEGVMYLPLTSEDDFRASPLASDSASLSLSVSGAAVEAASSGDLHWFVSGGYAVIAREEAPLRAAAEAFFAPAADVPRAGAMEMEAPNDAILFARLDNVLPLLPPGSGASARKLGTWYNEVLASIALAPPGEASTLRVRAYKRAPSDTVPAPLELRHPSGPDTILNVALGHCAALLDLAPAISRDTGSGAASMDYVKTFLSNSVALSVDIGTAGLPELKLSLKPVEPDVVPAFLGQWGMRPVPTAEYAGVQLYGVEGQSPLIGGLAYGFKGDILIASNSPAALRSMVDGLAAPMAPSAGDPNRADLTLDLAKAASSPMMGMASMMLGPPGGPLQSGENPFAAQPPVELRAWEHPDSLVLELTYSIVPWVFSNLDGPSEAVRFEALSSSSQNNQKQLGLIFKMYANESEGGLFPPLMEAPGHLMFAPTDAADYREGLGMPVYPEYLIDTLVLTNPGAPDRAAREERASENPVSIVDDKHYIYLGYFVRDQAEMDAFTQAYLAWVDSGETPRGDLEFNGQTVYRLKEGVERVAYDPETDPIGAVRIQSEVPILLERPGVWEDGAVNVLYLDGHVARVPHGEFPNTDAFWASVKLIDSRK